MIGLRFRAQLPEVVAAELDNLVAGIRGLFLVEHNDDGTHDDMTVSGDVVADGIGTFAGQHRAFAKATAITLSNDAETVLAFDMPAPDGATADTPDSGWNVGGICDSNHPTLFIAQATGLYLINYSIRFTGSATGVRYCFITTTRKGSPADLCQKYEGGLANGNTVADSLVLPLRVGEGVRLTAYQNSGGGLAIVTGFLNSWLQMTKIG